MKYLLTTLLALTLASTALAEVPLKQRIETAIKNSDHSALKACFNFEGIEEDLVSSVDKLISDIISLDSATVELKSFDEAKTKEWSETDTGLNGTPSADVHIIGEKDGTPKSYSMVAGTSPKGYLVLLSNKKITGEQTH